MPTLAPGQPIPTPADFPVQWSDPKQARLLWTLDKIHFAEPVPPLVASIWGDQVARAFNRTAEMYRLPVRLAFLPVNSYLYTSYRPAGAPPDIVLHAMNWLQRFAPGVVDGLVGKVTAGLTRGYMEQLEPVITDLDNYWSNQWQPELAQHLARWEAFDLEGAAHPSLLAHLEDSLQWLERVWEIHMQLVIPSFLAINLFAELYGELFGRDEADPFGPFRLLQGLDNAFLQAERALWRLSRQALTMPLVCRLVEQEAVERLVPALQQSAEGQVFLVEWQAFLGSYGQRGQLTDGLSEPSWREEPAPLLKSLREYLARPDYDFEAEFHCRVAEREQALVQVQERLNGQPQAVVERFERMLKAAQTAAFLHEEHNFWIDQQAMAQVRRVVLTCGRRLAEAGLLERPEDIFYLVVNEIREAALGQSKADWQAIVRNRQAEEARFSLVTPPPAIGAMPLLPLPDDPFVRSFTRVTGEPLIPAAPGRPVPGKTLYGHAGSPGCVRGRARVVRKLADAGQLQPGEVLVAKATLPPWTPLFAIAAAVVTDVGGVLSHSAIVAREYGIPAVVGVGQATAAIDNGRFIEVNGNTGQVHLL
ncbi:MAG: hypothetical protein L0332_24615 [Chloroflexi bacterium]|nr:hypothetical protein [Chloroflexota bacterium]MCI0579889.1 hypothetical protein [Chloroflexota bacterium]MCI0646170.1 hypothetical protein [Chloroflexota bacterium]MCI0729880.1 hypothetical protein [Chloroflexota bacterium]